MDKIFSVYAANGSNRYAELERPASDYEMLDLMDRLRLAPGQLPYLEVLSCHEYDYLEKCIQDQPDIYQLNALARKLAELQDTHSMAEFEGFVGLEMESGRLPVPLTRLIDFACSEECCYIAADAVTDCELGRFLADGGFVPETDGLSDAAFELLDFDRIGREHRQKQGGVFTGFGYVEPHTEPPHISGDMDFQPHKPSYTALLHATAYPTGKTFQLELPATDGQMRDALEQLEKTDWNSVKVKVRDSPIPRWKNTLYWGGKIHQLNELAQCLRELDEQGQLPKYKAILEMNDCGNGDLARMLSLAGEVDSYSFRPQISGPEDAARGKLSVIVSTQDAEMLLPHINLYTYGRALLERDQAVATSYGVVEQAEGQHIEQSSMGGMTLS